jgi:hypothetical protein
VALVCSTGIAVATVEVNMYDGTTSEKLFGFLGSPTIIGSVVRTIAWCGANNGWVASPSNSLHPAWFAGICRRLPRTPRDDFILWWELVQPCKIHNDQGESPRRLITVPALPGTFPARS